MAWCDCIWHPSGREAAGAVKKATISSDSRLFLSDGGAAQRQYVFADFRRGALTGNRRITFGQLFKVSFEQPGAVLRIALHMAKVALEHGKDPEVRALAQKVIAAQEAEIKDMQAWLDKKGVAAEKPLTAADHAAMGH